MMKQKWQIPALMTVAGLPRDWGSCLDGTTATAGYCAYGDQTGEFSHVCSSGGAAGGDSENCQSGSTPGQG